MARLTIRTFDDPVLRKKAKPVKTIDAHVRRLIEDMEETMYAAPGLGLAANQVGVLKRVLLADCGDGLIALVNPKIVAHSEPRVMGMEGCLSFPNWFGEVARWETVTVKGLNPQGKAAKIEAEGLLARCFQHEIDHLDGKVFVDIAVNLREVTPEEWAKSEALPDKTLVEI